jgi:hypothetical protein
MDIIQTILTALCPQVLIRNKLIKCLSYIVLVVGINKNTIVKNLNKETKTRVQVFTTAPEISVQM